MWHYGWGWGWGWVMVIMMIIFWGLVIGGIVYAISAVSRSGRGWGGPPQSPLDILDQRYARGEITREQYEQMRQDLLGRGGGSAASGG